VALAKADRVKQALVHLKLAMQVLDGGPAFDAVAADARALYKKLQDIGRGGE
jgi:hypothetical protein